MSAEIRSAIGALIDLDLTDWGRVASLASLGVSARFNSVALDSASTYEDVFVAGLQLRHFSVCLRDFSYFQLSEERNFSRLAFYPNPFLLPDHLLELIDDPTDFEAFEIDELKATGSRSPIRFDLSPGAYQACLHPYAHLHLGHGELGRLACSRVLTSEAFCLFVAKLFYPEQWATKSLDHENNFGFANLFDQRFADRFAAAVRVGEDSFSRAEASLPHIG